MLGGYVGKRERAVNAAIVARLGAPMRISFNMVMSSIEIISSAVLCVFKTVIGTSPGSLWRKIFVSSTLRSITLSQFFDWKAYFGIEPFFAMGGSCKKSPAITSCEHMFPE
jgi:hypothetical protein